MTLLDLFEGRRQLIVYHFMFDPEWEDGLPELHGRRRRDGGQASSRTCTPATRRSPIVSRAPLAKLERYKAKRGWTFPWYSSYGSDFNYDFHVTIDESVAPAEYNYRTQGGAPSGGTAYYFERRPAGRAARPELLPARRRSRLPHLLDRTRAASR